MSYGIHVRASPAPASMKVPPKRKGNALPLPEASAGFHCLNESPSQKEGKYKPVEKNRTTGHASMKVPPKRKGNGAT